MKDLLVWNESLPPKYASAHASRVSQSFVYNHTADSHHTTNTQLTNEHTCAPFCPPEVTRESDRLSPAPVPLLPDTSPLQPPSAGVDGVVALPPEDLELRFPSAEGVDARANDCPLPFEQAVCEEDAAANAAVRAVCPGSKSEGTYVESISKTKTSR